MDIARKLVKNGYRPKWWANTAVPYLLSKIKSKAEIPMYRYFERATPAGVEIMDEGWDNLLLLDACRWDMFKELNTIDGDLDYRFSKGSDTPEFLEENFHGAVHHDTVYVTANPMHVIDEWCSVDCYEVFHDVVDVWEGHWDDDLNTVHPQQMAEIVETVAESYPDKRMFAHFIQPHHPFIGEMGRQLRDTGMIGKLKAKNELIHPDDRGMRIWNRLRRGEVSEGEVWQAYRENLTVVLPYVETLVEKLRGKTVITSDHGNVVGEFCWPFPFREYGHPGGLHVPMLVKVPWLTIENGVRPEIEEELPTSDSHPHDVGSVEDRLEALGYR